MGILNRIFGNKVKESQDIEPKKSYDNQTAISCHLWNNENLTKEELLSSLEVLNTYSDDADLIRKLLQCKVCKQLYFYEFLEYRDYENGKDPSYRTWIPVKNIDIANKLSTARSFDLLQYSSIRIDFPADATAPSKPYCTIK